MGLIKRFNERRDARREARGGKGLIKKFNERRDAKRADAWEEQHAPEIEEERQIICEERAQDMCEERTKELLYKIETLEQQLADSRPFVETPVPSATLPQATQQTVPPPAQALSPTGVPKEECVIL